MTNEAVARKIADEKLRKVADGPEHRTNVITVRVTPHERAVLDMVSAHLGDKLSMFVRDCALGTAWAVIESGGGLERFVQMYEQDQGRRAAEAVKTVLKGRGED